MLHRDERDYLVKLARNMQKVALQPAPAPALGMPGEAGMPTAAPVAPARPMQRPPVPTPGDPTVAPAGQLRDVRTDPTSLWSRAREAQRMRPGTEAAYQAQMADWKANPEKIEQALPGHAFNEHVIRPIAEGGMKATDALQRAVLSPEAYADVRRFGPAAELQKRAPQWEQAYQQNVPAVARDLLHGARVALDQVPVLGMGKALATNGFRGLATEVGLGGARHATEPVTAASELSRAAGYAPRAATAANTAARVTAGAERTGMGIAKGFEAGDTANTVAFTAESAHASTPTLDPFRAPVTSTATAGTPTPGGLTTAAAQPNKPQAAPTYGTSQPSTVGQTVAELKPAASPYTPAPTSSTAGMPTPGAPPLKQPSPTGSKSTIQPF